MRRTTPYLGVRGSLAIGLGVLVLATHCRADDSPSIKTVPVNPPAAPTAGAPAAAAQQSPFAGKFADDKLTLDLHDSGGGYAGSIALGANKFNATATLADGQLTGSFDANGTPFKFTATRSGGVVTLISGKTTYTLKLVEAAPGAAPTNPGAANINPGAAAVIPLPATENPGPAPTNPTPAPVNPVQGASPAPAAPAADVLRFQTFSVQDDPNWIGGEAMTLLIPEGWKVQGGMEWRPETVLRVQPHLQVSDPNSPAQMTLYPTQTFTWGVKVRGPSYLGDEIQPLVRNYSEALSKYVIPRFRTDLGDAKVVETEDLPEWANTPSIWVQPAPGAPMHGSAGRVRVEYEINGQPVQEDFFVRVQDRFRPRMQSTGWIIEVVSVRSAKGELDKMRPILRTVALSKRLSLPWYNKLQQYVIITNKMTLDRIKAEGARAQIRSQLSNEVSDANKQEYESRQKTEDASNQATAETMRDQQPWTTTSGGKVELPIQAGIVWQGANGEIVTTNDALYNPNSDPNKTSTYTQLQKAPGLNGK